MDEKLEAVTVEAVAALKQAGALFGYLHGSRATGQNRADEVRPSTDADGGARPGYRSAPFCRRCWKSPKQPLPRDRRVLAAG